MPLTLGLDLGPTSIGWALVDEQRQTMVRTGVRVFPEGVDRDQQGGEKSKSQARRTARGTRRLLSRRARRRRKLRAALTEAGLLPSDPHDLQQLLQTNPYPLRARACRERIEPFELGRVLLHLNQRRGFLSNRKTDRSDKDLKGMHAEMNALVQAMRRADAPTLGTYLATLNRQYDHTSSPPQSRPRYRPTRRQMYVEEFEAIWREQTRHHPQLLTPALKRRLYDPTPNDKWVCQGLIFGQRRVYWPKSVIGRCDLERNQPRCPRAHLAAQRFRIYQEVNNLDILDRATGEHRRLTQPEREVLYEYLDQAKQRTFDQIRRKLGFSSEVQFNFERGRRTKLQGNETAATLASKKRIGPRWWKLSTDIQHAIVDILLNEELEEQALRRLVQECDLSPDEAQRSLGAHLPDGHANYCLVAIDKLLPHLQRGLFLMGNDPSDSAIHAAGYLRPDERELKLHDFLPPAPDLPNPIVRQALIETRKIVNAILREYVYRRNDTLTEIRVELAREAKRSFEQRTKIRIEQAERRRTRENAKAEIEKLGLPPNRANIQRYLLWQEQNQFCPYSQSKIALSELFSDAIDIDHILPRWRSLDNSMANKVVCRVEQNRLKGDRTPAEWLADSDPDKYERVLRIADRLPGNKPLKFRQRNIVLDEFVNRQFTDTAYISRCVSQYLRSIGTPVRTTRGDLTADLRHWWDLNKILDPDRGRKMRNDHRHHAVDAVVVALMTPKRLHALANAPGDQMPPPWDRFLDQARESILAIHVSHRPLKRLRGSLHNAMFHGPTSKPERKTDGSDRPWAGHWVEDPHTFVRRKAVTEITNARHLCKVRDPAIREILRQHLTRQGIDPDKKGDYPTNAFAGNNTPRMPSGVPIRKVRMLERSETFRPVSDRREFQFVKPDSNHHIVYREQGDGDKPTWTAKVVPMWDVARRAKRGLPLVDRATPDGQHFRFSLALGESFLMNAEDGTSQLCVVQKLDQRSKRIHYFLHHDARPRDEIKKDNQYLSVSRMQRVQARKVTVDPLGRIRWAND